jgi:histidinol dehydrogenase
MKTYTYSELTPDQVNRLIRRPKMDFASVFSTVQPILDDVESRGDEAVREYTKKFDAADLKEVTVDPNSETVTLENDVKRAIDISMKNIYRFHREQFSMEL